MRALIFISLLSASICRSQTDTLQFNNEIDANNHLFALLDSAIYGPSLLNRHLSIDSTIIDQLNGDYSNITGLLNWASVFNTVSLSYTDHAVIPSIPDFAFEISNYFGELEFDIEEILIQPFSLILHQSSYIDSITFTDSAYADTEGHILPLADETNFYKKMILKSAAILEFYPNSGYDEGNLIYNADYVFTSENISVLELEINIGDSMGFQPFGISNPIISYNRLVDSTVAIARVTYLMDSDTLTDSLFFYLTTVSYPDGRIAPKSGWDAGEGYDMWNYVWHYDPIEGNDLTFTIGVKFGCGNTAGIRRPIIIVAPYRPAIQPFSMKKYWNQFNIGGIYDLWHELGYDILYIKEKPGHNSLEQVGTELMVLVDSVNRIKKHNYPNEDWETIVMGYSMGGQVARYGLLKAEKEHMETRRVHPHVRQYIAFDSPHLGVNIPLATQAVYKSFRFTNLIAATSYSSMVDEASSDMGYYAIEASESLPSINGDEFIPHPDPLAVAYQSAVNNDFIHAYTPLGDLRTSFPSFTRNVAVSTGSYINDYEMEWGLTPGMLMFEQNAVTYRLGLYGFAKRKSFASEYSESLAKNVFNRYDIYYAIFFPLIVKDNYKFKYNFEWDMAQGGYKTLFYDGLAGGANTILRASTAGVGTQYYKEEVMFLPLVSALAINPSIWADNDLYYNLQVNDMFFIDPSLPATDNYGYPHLGHPTNHFEITPFEAVYADQYSYDHIKMHKTVADYEEIGELDLGRVREFMFNEVEPWNFPLQNKIIGANHVIDPSYEYKAWYKARGAILIGNSVTPRTNPGDYIIQATGNITVYAGSAVDIKPGFHAKAGSTFHAFIETYTPCEVMGVSTPNGNGNGGTDTDLSKEIGYQAPERINERETVYLYPNPNQGNFTFSIASSNPLGTLCVYTLSGQLVHKEEINATNTVLNLNLAKGLYLVSFENDEKLTTLKMLVQ